MKKILTVAVIGIMLLSSLSINATEDMYKNEAIYGILDESGLVEHLYVVNGIDGTNKDYGNYKDIINMTTLDAITINDDEITIPDSEDTFYYQGTMDNEMSPWLFDISYSLDGEAIEAKDLAGKSGALSIQITIDQGNEDKEYFFENYALQVSMALSSDISKNVIAHGATIVDAGGDKQIAFTVLPGTTGTYEVTADVTDFEMDAIMINGVKMVFDLDVDTSAFTDQIETLITAVEGLDDGALELSEGLNALAEGMVSYTAGLEAYTSGLNEFASSGSELTAGFSALKAGLAQTTAGGDQLKAGIEAFEAGVFMQTEMELKEMGAEIPTLTKDNYQMILSSDEALAPVLEQLTQTLMLTEGMVAYMNGVEAIEQGMTGFSNGLNTYVDSADLLAKSASDLYDGAVSINEGLSEINQGMASYHEGTTLFRDNIGQMDAEVAEQIDGMLGQFMGEDQPLMSFASDKNEHIGSVQFFYRTSGITIPEVKVETVKVEEKETFFKRLLRLFGIK